MTATVELVRRHIERGDVAADADQLDRFVQALLTKVDESFFEQFDSEAIYAMAIDGFEFLRAVGSAPLKVEVFNPTFAADGFEAPFTVVRLVLEDRPFIVDSVQAELARQKLDLAYQLHPIVEVLRSPEGELLDVESKKSNRCEAFEMFFIERLSEEQLPELEKRLKTVLNDVILATDDYRAMRSKAEEVAGSLHALAASGPTPGAMITADRSAGGFSEEIEEYAAFIEWLDEDNFVFLGYREYSLVELEDETHLQVVKDSGLGILSRTAGSRYRKPVPLSAMAPQLRERVKGGRVLVVTKTNAEATVHRVRRMDYVGVKLLDEVGDVVGEQRFIGLFTSAAQSTPVDEIPVLRRKLRQVLEADEALPGSHDYKAIVTAFNSMPREDLFGNEAEQLHQDIRSIISLEQERGAKLRLRPDPLKRGIGAMVMMPRESFTGDVRRAIQSFLQERLQASHVDYRLALGEDQNHARFHFYFVTDIDLNDVDVKELERTVVDLARSWREELRDRLIEANGEVKGRALAKRYAEAFDEGYEAEVSAAQAVRDIGNLESLPSDRNGFDLLNPVAERGSASALIFYPGTFDAANVGRGRALSDVLPLLENLGLRVLDQNPYNLSVDGVKRAVDVYRVQSEAGAQLDIKRDKARLLQALAGLVEGSIENDDLNRLVLRAGLDHRQVALLRAYQMYYSQLNLVTSRAFVSLALLAHPDVAARLMAYFETRFDPQLREAGGGATLTAEARRGPLETAAEAVLESLAGVSSLAEDQALRGLLDLMQATVRTNYYNDVTRISFKLDSARVGSMPEPRPLYEIAVSSGTVEGTHLRGGMVARGGIRWSDRPDDFRTEVLGLMKTQMTKNAVIVPVGSKGGFVVKGAPSEREALRAYVREQYKEYVSGLLDLTDNLVGGEVVRPENMVIYDGPDTYLVVAADKGTATFSDLANATAAEYDFWLGDAFASGGSAGYDHKGMGITARGAWECVKRLFAELGVNVARDTFTVVGIGDMSGDVFGNGMLYSDRIRLQAAFNHLHVFIDPEPDPEVSFAERKRLYELPRSSWADYDANLISAGGGVFERSAKSIPLSAEMRAMLGVDDEAMSGQDLIRAVLRMQADLLWNGGIGTYVKSSSERNAEVGDSANDGVRIDADDLNVRVVGEGGNLGFTQLARIEYARGGGKNDTDAIHNSAGVDTSDHEVNIKIALQPALASGAMSRAQRDELLAAMTDEVAGLVLRDNDRQSQALSLALRAAHDLPELFASLLDYLSETAGLNRAVEYLPTNRQLAERLRDGVGLTRPELAVMLAYVKMGLYRRLLETDLPDEPQLRHYLHDYFPPELHERAPDAASQHSLHREITATQITNSIVDLLGIDFVHRAVRQNGATPIEVVRAALVAIELLDVLGFARRLDAVQEALPPEAGYAALREMTKAVDGIVSWLLFNDLDRLPIEELVSTYREPLDSLRSGLEGYLPSPERRRYKAGVKQFGKAGHDEQEATALAVLEYLPSGIGVVEAARSADVELESAATAFYGIGERLALGYLRDALSQLDTAGSWEQIALTGLTMDLRAIQQRLTAEYLAALSGDPKLGVEEFLQRLPSLKRYDSSLRELKVPGALTLAGGSVLARLLAQPLSATA